MNHPRNKLNQRQEEEHASVHQQAAQHQNGIEFQSAEEMLRYDRGRTPVPGGVADRLNRQDLPKPARPWWRFWGT